MLAGTIEHVKQDAARVVRNLPDAHAAWQFFWRDAAFRRAIGAIDRAIYALKVETFSDDDFQLLERTIRAVINAVEIHASGLGTAVQHRVDRESFREVISRLETALEGLEQGLAPDPANRPSGEQLLDRFAEMLERQPLNLPDHTSRVPASTS